jgi:hypothetical protein
VYSIVCITIIVYVYYFGNSIIICVNMYNSNHIIYICYSIKVYVLFSIGNP